MDTCGTILLNLCHHSSCSTYPSKKKKKLLNLETFVCKIRATLCAF